MKEDFVSLYNSESDAIFRYCYIRTSNRESALDLTQDTFMRFWDSLSRGKKITNKRAFLFTIARNLVIDWYRKEKPVSLEGLAEGNEGDFDSLLPIEEGVHERIEMDSEGRYLIEKIKELHPTYQQAVYLRFVEDLKPEEIAEALGISVTAASVRIHRGLKELRDNTGYKKDEHKQT